MDEPPRNVVPYRSPNAGEEATQLLGMVVFLCGWAMLFCGLLLAYGVIRSTTHPWPPADEPRPPRALGLMATALIAGASVAYHLAYRRLRESARGGAVLAFAISLGLSGMTVAIQLASVAVLRGEGLSLASGAYASILFTLIGFHVLHHLVGMGGQILVAWKALRGLYSPARHQPVRLWGLYVHAVCAVWCVIYLAVYLA